MSSGYVKDVLVRKVAEAFQELATCILQYAPPSSSSWQTPARERLLKRLLLFHCRSKDVLAEFSGYFCLRVLLDIDSPLATYFIDLFHQLEWLLEALLRKSGKQASVDKLPLLPEDLYHKINDLLACITPAARACRGLARNYQPFLLSAVMKREAKAHRDFPMDDFQLSTKMLAFANLDRCQEHLVELGNELGQGSYGTVYEGRFVTRKNSDQAPRTIGEPVAVKVFREMWDEPAGSSKSLGSQFFDRMEKMVQLKESLDTASLMTNELWMLVTAKHPNVVTARGYIGKRRQGDSGLVMELMSTNLQKYLQEVDKPLEELEMVDLMLEIAKGMRFLHECGLVHKDLKPQNILLRPYKKVERWDKYPAMEVKLADFGNTKRIIEAVTYKSGTNSTPVGTHCYMAPEMRPIPEYQTSNYQVEADVFSYGTTCFNILTCNVTGARVFTSEDPDAFYEAVKMDNWGAWVKGKPEYLIDLIAKCWDFDPMRRPTFATISSVLQHAMLWILSSPLIIIDHNRRIYPQFSCHPFADAYWLQSEIDAQTRLHDDAHSFVMEWGHNENSPRLRVYNTAPRTVANVHGLLSKLQRKKTKEKSKAKPSKPVAVLSKRVVFAPIDKANDSDGANAYTSTPVVRVMIDLQSGPRFFQIPLTTMDPAWIVFEALVHCFVYSYSVQKREFDWFRPTYKFELGGCPPFQEDDAKRKLDVDRSLIPFLICFWERGYQADWSRI